ncbi:hypothetical protein AYI69_g5975, partial [Smittium culicis]
MVFSISK